MSKEKKDFPDDGSETPAEKRRWRRTRRALWVVGQVLTLGLLGAAFARKLD